ncbi:MAG: phosphate ABC transporter substrate-binding protein [Gammaproteobacteria bacterium]|nr:phosphate ABC transporter substrate-binding protein [Gammaproteobacteria bacterium]
MSKLQNVFGSVLAILLLVAVIPNVQAEIAVITNPDVKEIGLSKDKLADIYLGRKKSYSDGSRVEPVDQEADTAVRDKFYRAVVKMSNSEVNRYWAKLKFTGKGKPPRVVNGDESVRDWVASHSGAIGYIDGKYLNDSVKVVLIIP